MQVRALLVSLAVLFSTQATALTGHSEDLMVLVDVPRDVVSSWLPKDLTIDSEGDTHKVWMNFGKQGGVGVILPPYYELSVKVTDVRFKADAPATAERYNYYEVLYMNNYSAVFWGIVLYDSPKIYAPMTMTDNLLTIRDKKTKELLFTASFRPGSSGEIPLDHPNVKEFGKYTSTKRLTYRRGKYKCWGVKGKNAKVIPYYVDVEIYPGYLPGLDSLSQSFGPIDTESLGAFMDISDWRFSRVDCGR